MKDVVKKGFNRNISEALKRNSSNSWGQDCVRVRNLKILIVYFSLCSLIEASTMSLINTLMQQLKPKELLELKGDNFPCLIPESNKARGNKGNRCFECMPCCYWNVITYFNQKTIDALVKCTRLSLDSLKRRMQPPSKYNASSDSGIPNNSDSKSAFFKVGLALS